MPRRIPAFRKTFPLLLGAAVLACGRTERTAADGGHDHGARHGGVVAMAGDLHAEAIAQPDGTVRVYLSDRARRPLPPDDARGSVALDRPAGTFALAPTRDHLEAHVPPLVDDDVVLHLALERAGRPFELHVRVPVGSDGSAGFPRVCVPANGRAVGDGPTPRCTMRLPGMVRGLAVTPDGGTVVVDVFGHGVTAWRLPDARLAFALTPAPDRHDHAGDDAHPVDLVAIRPDGGEVAATAHGRILRYRADDGELVADVPGADYPLGALAWSRDGARLLASAFFDGTLHVLRADDGAEVGRLATDHHLSAVAVSSDGRLAALASELGPVTVFDVDRRRMIRRIDATTAAQAVAFAGDRAVVAREDGVVVFWDATSGERVHETSPGPATLTLAATRAGDLVACGRVDGVVDVRGATGDVVATLPSRGSPIRALAWAGDTLVSGAADGDLALWEIAPLVGTSRHPR
jgi:hypothetical protein